MSINVTHNGYHNTEAYYRSSYADGSLFNQLQQYSPTPQIAPALNAPFWQSLMSTQQNLFAGWNSFCGCSGARPQPQPQPQPQPSGEGQCASRRRRVDVHVHHHFYQNGCGGPFNCGGSASGASQTHSAFGSRGACSNWQQSARSSCYTPFATNNYQSFGFGYTGLYGCAPNPSGYSGSYGNPGGVYSGSYGNPGGAYSGSYGNPGGVYSGSYGNPGGAYSGSYGNPYGSYQGSYGSPYGNFQGCYGSPAGSYQASFGNAYGSFQASVANSCNNTYGLPQTLPSYNWGDFSASFGRDSSSPFGVVPSAYAGYAMTSPFTSFGTAAGLAAIGGALSLLF